MWQSQASSVQRGQSDAVVPDECAVAVFLPGSCGVVALPALAAAIGFDVSPFEPRGFRQQQ
jgi:hypothetical protein